MLIQISYLSKLFAQPLTPAKKPALMVNLFFEKVYIHTDKDYYTNAEDIWFKAYLVNAQNNTSINKSNNLYVELISPDAKIIYSEIIALNNGMGKGDFKLTDSIAPGNYRLRAYTNWMRNFGDNFIFEKAITITKPLTIETANPIVQSTPKVNDVLVNPIHKPVVLFFPEGGSLVEGVAGLVAFKTEGKQENGLTVKACVISSAGDTISRFESTNKGVGSFIMVPEAKTAYIVKGTLNNTEPFAVQLPVALPKGFVIHVSDADSAHFRVTISTNKATMADYPDKQVTLTGRHAGVRFLNGPVQFVFLQINALIAKKQFPPGVSSLTVYDALHRAQCERLVFVDNAQTLKSIIVKLDKPVYGNKEKTTVRILVADTAQHGVKANLSLSAVDAGIIPVQDDNIISYLLLQSELKGKIKHAAKYFDTTNVNRFKELDLLLLTQGWRDFIWHRLADTSIRISYAPQSGFELSGRLREKIGNKPLSGINVLLAMERNQRSMQYAAISDSLGFYNFKGVNIVGKQLITLTSFDNKKKKAGWLFLDSIKKPESLSVIFYRDIKADTSNQHAFLSLQTERRKTTRFKFTDTVRLTGVKIKDTRPVTMVGGIAATTFGYPDQVFNITSKDQYYETLDNWIAHNVAGAHLGSDDTGGIYFPGISSGEFTARLIVNGVELSLSDSYPPSVINQINMPYYNLSMDKVTKVVVKHLVGAKPDSTKIYDFHLIYLTIKPDAFDKKDFNRIDTTITGYYEARTFYKPTYENGINLNKTDLRSTIHWEPEIITDKNGVATVSFYNADFKTKIRVVVQGITDAGMPVVTSLVYLVK